MILSSAQRLTYLCNIVPPLLKKIPEAEYAHKPANTKWSKKQILGHLVDSAANNHQRFVRAQFEHVPYIVYDQNNWNTYSYYQEMNTQHIIQFWEMYNKHLLEILNKMPPINLLKTCKTNEPHEVTIQWLIDDYVMHTEMHLKQVVVYK